MKPLSDLATISIRSHIYLPMFANVSDSYIHNVIFFSTTILQQISLGAKKNLKFSGSHPSSYE